MEPLLWNELRASWLSAALEALNPEPALRAALQAELAAFFDALVAAANAHDPQPVVDIVARWVEGMPGTPRDDPGLGKGLEVFQVVVRLQRTTDQVIARTWQGDREWLAQRQLLPVWQHLLAWAAEKEMEERLRRLRIRDEEIQSEILRLNKTKAAFISVAAHELRTPLTVVEGYASMMQSLLEELGHPVLLQYLAGIRRGAARMREIVDDLIDLSQLHANALEISFQPLWLNRLFQSLALELEPVLQERRQTLEVRDFPGSDRMLYADPERLRQAFYHLLTNAIKYTPDGGQIVIDGRLLPGFVEVTVSDTGIGIDPEYQDYIFDFFTRVGNPMTHSTSKTKFKGGGPGLGLPIAKGIIEAHGGTIWVESPGYDEETCPGSTFHVLLPIHEEPPEVQWPALSSRRRAEAVRRGQGGEEP